MREEELKNKIAKEYFPQFDTTQIVGNIDFAISPREGLYKDEIFYLWAEAKRGNKEDIYESFVQLILTIGQPNFRSQNLLPPAFLGAFDAEKIAFVPYNRIQDIFYQNDFNWNVRASDHTTKEFKQLYERVQSIIHNDVPFETYLFDFEKDEKELRRFIRENFVIGKVGTTKIRIDKNNFKNVYNRWVETVKPTIAVNWEIAKENGIIDADFFLADLLSKDNISLKDSLFVVLSQTHYQTERSIDKMGMFRSAHVDFSDRQQAHNLFWAKYERPPHEDYWDYIIERRDILVPPDIRERKGSFFTPRIWVEKSQEYLALALGENWQDEYYVWDCCAGSGNLLEGLVNKYRIFASTLDRQDVDVMRQRIADRKINLLDSHVFQFDFLNDSFDKLPMELLTIINNDKLRRRLVVYINPPYAEAASATTVSGTGENKKGVSTVHRTHGKYIENIGNAVNELSAQFMARIYAEISNCKVAIFSKLAYLNSANYRKFRHFFLANLEKGFVIPSFTFDNVKGKFPIGFLIWDTGIKKHFTSASLDVFDKDNKFTAKKIFHDLTEKKYINDWYSLCYDTNNTETAIMNTRGNDFQNHNYIRISSDNNFNHTNAITANNLIESCIYFAVRKVIPATWLNDRDQFLFPNNNWENDTEFHNDCLSYSLFSNNISSKYGINHWIPFFEQEVDASAAYESHFMVSFLSGKVVQNAFTEDLFEKTHKSSSINFQSGIPRQFSPAATAVFDAGRELWKYYHAQPDINVNASLYDIREHFQGRNEKGKMNAKSTDERYNELIANLRDALDALARKIEPKVYEYEFLLR